MLLLFPFPLPLPFPLCAVLDVCDLCAVLDLCDLCDLRDFFVFLLFFQWWYVSKFPQNNQGEKKHFLVYFALQYILIVITALFSAFFVYYFFQSQSGLQMLEAYIQQSLVELNSFKEVIVSQEGGEYYNSLHAGIKSIDAYSIAKDDFSQKIALGFLPNLLISLYYKK